MTKIIAKIEKKPDGTYFAQCHDGFFSGKGSTAEFAKLDMEQQMLDFRLAAHREHFDYPDFLDKDYRIVYEGELPASRGRDVVNPDYLNWKIPVSIIAILALIMIFCVSAETGIVLIVFLVVLLANLLIVGVVVSIIISLLK